MKKVLSIAVLLGAMSASAESYLYWMVGDTGNFSYDNAQVRVFNDGEPIDYLSLYYADGTAVGDTKVSAKYAETAQKAELGLYAKLGSLLGEDYYYIIELRNDDGAFVAQSGELSYSAALNNIVDSGLGIPSGGTGWDPTSGGGTYNVPEPTSGIMMLLGVAALALRRRRRV